MTEELTTQNRQRDLYAVIGTAKISEIVDDFYGRIQHHATLAVPFKAVHDWDEHKKHLAHFWWISLGGPAYRTDRYRVAEKHVPLGITPELVGEWLALFRTTLLDHLPAELADPWFARASNMGESIKMMAEFYQS